MKKTNSKNYIAFTLAEMTLVLLITSIIAATATPMITSSVSDFTNQYKMGGSADAPWVTASNYLTDGIYNNQKTNTAFVSINYKPSGAAGNYDYPALLVNKKYVINSNLVNAPQIQISTTTPTSPLNTYISMDEYDNVYLAYGPHFQTANYVGTNNVILGSNFGSKNNDSCTDLFFKKSVHLGYGISASNADNMINIGSNLVFPQYETDAIGNGSINMGNDIWGFYSTSKPDVMYYRQNNIRIGSYASSMSSPTASIIMGNYASYASSGKNTIAIGPFAGYGFMYSTVTTAMYPYDNIFVGRYAGAGVYTNMTTAGSNAKRQNVMIGNYAGLVDLGGFSSLPWINTQNNVYIGNYAGAFNRKSSETKIAPSSSTWARTGQIFIGNYANYTGYTGYGSSVAANVSIGNYAGFSSLGMHNVMLGNQAGRFAYANNSIIIGGCDNGNTYEATGSFVGTQLASTETNISKKTGLTYSMIAIGRGAGKQTQTQARSIFIGHDAGAYAINSASEAGNNIGIGYNACSGVSESSTFTGRNKICIGSGTLRSTLSATDTVNGGGTFNVWTPTDNAGQMIIGSITSTTNNSITLYAGTVYGPSTNFYTFSDKRLKENITPSKYGWNDIRKVNIVDYNFKNDAMKTQRIGVIAQEFRKIFPMSVSKEPNYKFFCVNPNWMNFVMVNATKEVDKKVQQVTKEVEQYINDFMGLKSKVAKMEQQAEQIKKENAEMKKHLAEINKKLK